MNRRKLNIAAGIVLALAGYFGWQQFGVATLTVTSVPDGAEVIVDSEVVGRTPLDAFELSVGVHRVEVRHSFYAPVTERIDVSRGDHVARALELRTAPGRLALLSNPKGAWVEVDGVRQPGRTPMTVVLESGVHQIVMGQSERRAASAEVTVPAGDVAELNLELNMDPHGSVTFVTNPARANVELLDSDIEYVNGGRVPIGPQRFRISHQGFASQDVELDVNYGENRTHVVLQRAYGQLALSLQPAGAWATVRYQDASGQWQEGRYKSAIRVPAGRVEVTVAAIGYRTVVRRVDIQPDTGVQTIRLSPINVKPGERLQDRLEVGGLAPAMVVVPPGRFSMGDAAGGASERPVREVTIAQPFAMSVDEITVADYRKFTEATGRRMPEKTQGDDDQMPIRYVTWDDASAYASWLTGQTGARYRLPSEAQWEYAARGGSSSTYFFGDDPAQLCRYANVADQTTKQTYRGWETVDCDDGRLRPGSVGHYAPNPFGLRDIYGNVAEWVADCDLPDYARARSDGGVAGVTGGCDAHGYRGGSWDSAAAEASSAYRNTASIANDDRGIRLVREL